MDKRRVKNEICLILKTFAAVRAEGILKLDAIDEVIKRTGISREDVTKLLDASGVYELKEGTAIREDLLFDTKYRPDEMAPWEWYER